MSHQDQTGCLWPGTDPLYRAYHDQEWGVPEWDDRALFEKLILDGFQAGLSWITILRKRDAFREVFQGFEPEVLVKWGDKQRAMALGDARIIRSAAKIDATIGNARAYLALAEAGVRFSDFIWNATDGRQVINHWTAQTQVPTDTPASHALSKALKAKGFKFCGPVIVYAFMQAVGQVNDHLTTCARHKPCSTGAGGRPKG
jgi:DNA-3-methyladenine glycosylase I